jgi:hypothetical protein
VKEPIVEIAVDFQSKLHEEAVLLLRSKGAMPESTSLPNPDGASSPNDVKVTFGRYELWIYEDGQTFLAHPLTSGLRLQIL